MVYPELLSSQQGVSIKLNGECEGIGLCTYYRLPKRYLTKRRFN